MYMKQDLNFPSQCFTMFMFKSIYLLLVIPNVTSLNFSYTRFLPNDDSIKYDRDAIPPNYSYPVIQLNEDQKNSCGRVKYAQQMQLWEKTSRKLTDFTSRFSFVINSSSYADGFAFFLAANDSLPRDTVRGGTLCLTLDRQPINSIAYPFVAVEFDIFSNNYHFVGDWDTIPGEHVGVDINSVKSSAVERWEGAKAIIMAGNLCEAQITYNSCSLDLTVVFTGSRNNATIQQHLQARVDLRKYLPERVTFGFSAAAGGFRSPRYEIHSWNFSSTLEIQENKPVPGSQTNANHVGLAVGLGVGGFSLILMLGLISFVLWKWWKKDNEEEDQGSDEYMEEDFSSKVGPQKYSYAELASAANNFRDEQKLGQGGFWGVYKGFLKGLNSYVAIKRVSKDSRQGIKEFASEVRIISLLRHRNLVQLIGWCHEKKLLLLVYEYMPNGSLDFHLVKDQNVLTWEARYKIAQGLASAVLYLQEECEQCIVHRDIKSSNIMLDLNFNAKLGDFGLARLVNHAKGSRTTDMAGILGYMAPEYAITGRASKKSDVYSFRVTALEISCGRKPINSKAQENEINMVEWVWELYGNGRILEAADPRLCGYFKSHQMKCLMIVGLWCAHPDYYSRPSIRQAIQVLNFEAPLPNLPSSLPVLTYIEHPAKSAAECTTSSSVASLNQNTSSSFSGR